VESLRGSKEKSPSRLMKTDAKEGGYYLKF